MMKNFIQIFAFGLAIFAGLNNLSAQTFKATLIGQVADAAGASVPNATVTITQPATNQSQTVTTDGEGNFTISQLDPGSYTLRVEAANFKVLEQTNLVLETNQSARLNLTLEAGNVSETVTVEAVAPVINTETSSKGEVIVEKQVQELPLNGRNFTDLALLTPGVYRRPADDDQGEGLATSGTRTDASNFILDGINNRSDRNANIGVNTSVDSIREFRVETSTYSAEFGRTAGAQINVVSKSGTNRFSGSLFEYVRNDVFDAKNALAFDVIGTPTDESTKVLRRNQFGGTIGGPLPFLNFGEGGPVVNSGKDRTFFFASYEGTRERRSATSIQTAPNAAWLRGDFSALISPSLPASQRVIIYDPATLRCQNAAGQTTTVRTSTGGCPTISGVAFRAVVDPFPGNIIPLSRFSSVSRQILQDIPAANITGSNEGYVARGINRPDRNQYLLKLDHRISEDNSLYFRFARQRSNGYQAFPSARNFYPGFGRDALSRNDSYAVSDTHIFASNIVNEARFGYFNQDSQNLGQNRDQDYNALFGIPGVSPGAAFQGYPAIRIDGYSEFGDRPNDPFSYKLKTFQFFDSLSIVAGKHNLKLGVDIIRSNFVENDVRNLRGDFRFRGRNTNAPTATATNLNGATSSGVRSFADFLLGLPDTTSRQLGATPADTTGTQYAFFAQDDYRITNWLTLNLGLRYEYQTALSEKTGRLANLLISPNNVGTLVCPQEVRDQTTNAITCVSAASVGLPETLVKADKNNFGPRVGFALRPFKDDKTVIRGGAGIYYSLETFNPIRQQLAVQSPYLNRINYSRNANFPLSLSLSDPFPGGAAEGTPRGMNPDYKQPEIYQYNFTVERELAKDLVLEVGYVGSQGKFLGLRYNYNAALPTGTVINGVYQPFRRLQAQYGTATIQYQDQFGVSNYNALQTSLRRRAANGLTLLLSYTFSKSIDTGSSTNNSTTGSQDFPQDIRDVLGSQRGLSDFDRRHQFTGSFNYELPFGKGRGFFSDANGIVQTLVGGWQLNGIVSILSGRPFTPQYSAADVGAQRPDVIGDPYANIPAGLEFNPAAFRRPTATDGEVDLFGNAGRNILTGPKFRTFDLSLLKNVRLAEKTRLQFRVESFNVFNTPNYQVPIFQLDNANVGRVNITATEGREFQFAVKLLF
jgi:Carboxypeptidase regulatory-like domain/TonB dependent receptor